MGANQLHADRMQATVPAVQNHSSQIRELSKSFPKNGNNAAAVAELISKFATVTGTKNFVTDTGEALGVGQSSIYRWLAGQAEIPERFIRWCGVYFGPAFWAEYHADEPAIFVLETERLKRIRGE